MLCKLLPPANKVWDKVMFLHLCVILFTGRWFTSGWFCIQGGLHPRGLPLGGGLPPGGLHPGRLHPWRGSASKGRSAPGGSASRGVCIQTKRSASKVVCLQGPGGLGRPPSPSRNYRIRSTSRRYASCWNAFLLLIIP